MNLQNYSEQEREKSCKRVDSLGLSAHWNRISLQLSTLFYKTYTSKMQIYDDHIISFLFMFNKIYVSIYKPFVSEHRSRVASSTSNGIDSSFLKIKLNSFANCLNATFWQNQFGNKVCLSRLNQSSIAADCSETFHYCLMSSSIRHRFLEWFSTKSILSASLSSSGSLQSPSFSPSPSPSSSCFLFAVASSAACLFRHFVRRFWNQTWWRQEWKIINIINHKKSRCVCTLNHRINRLIGRLFGWFI